MGALDGFFVEYCPSDYTCHSFTVCEGDHCGEIPWPEPPDWDGDGYGGDVCAYPREDCDDLNPEVHPGAPEVCNGLDDDCDGETDRVQGTSLNLGSCRYFFVDRDGDGHGDPQSFACLCAPEPPYVASSGDDCDDSKPNSPFEPSGCVGGCPNGVREPPEDCDDGNLAPFDGCDSCTGKRNFITPAQWADVSDPAVGVVGEKVIVAWSARTTDRKRNVFVRAIDGETLQAGEIFGVSDVPSEYEGSPALAGWKDGRLLVAWDTVSPLDHDFEVRVRPFVGDEPSGPSLIINEHWQQRQLGPAVAVSDEAGLVVWQSYDQDGDGYEVYARFLDAGGIPSGPEFRVNQTVFSDQFLPVVTGLASDRFAVAWLSRYQGASKLSVVWTVFDAGMHVVVPETIVSEGEVSTEIGIASKSNRVSLVYMQRYSTGSEIYVSLHVKTMDPVSPYSLVHEVIEFPPPDGATLLYNPAIISTPEGFLVTYRAKSLDWGYQTEDWYSKTIFLARFNADGELLSLQTFPSKGSKPYWVEPDWPVPVVLPQGAYGAVFECVSRSLYAYYGRGICLSVFPSE